MKTRHHIQIALLAAFTSSGLHATAVENQLPVPQPDFMTSAQLTKWRADTTAKTVATEKAQATQPTATSTSFYTGKPYLSESGSYSFKYRDYNPEMNRWTTVDPSGFPDGANNRVYAAVPTQALDPNGAQTVTIEKDYDFLINGAGASYLAASTVGIGGAAGGVGLGLATGPAAPLVSTLLGIGGFGAGAIGYIAGQYDGFVNGVVLTYPVGQTSSGDNHQGQLINTVTGDSDTGILLSTMTTISSESENWSFGATKVNFTADVYYAVTYTYE